MPSGFVIKEYCQVSPGPLAQLFWVIFTWHMSKCPDYFNESFVQKQHFAPMLYIKINLTILVHYNNLAIAFLDFTVISLFNYKHSEYCIHIIDVKDTYYNNNGAVEGKIDDEWEEWNINMGLNLTVFLFTPPYLSSCSCSCSSAAECCSCWVCFIELADVGRHLVLGWFSCCVFFMQTHKPEGRVHFPYSLRLEKDSTVFLMLRFVFQF